MEGAQFFLQDLKRGRSRYRGGSDFVAGLKELMRIVEGGSVVDCTGSLCGAEQCGKEDKESGLHCGGSCVVVQNIKTHG